MNSTAELWWCLYGIFLGFTIAKSDWRGIFSNPKTPQPRRTPQQRHTRSHHYKATRHGRR